MITTNLSAVNKICSKSQFPKPVVIILLFLRGSTLPANLFGSRSPRLYLTTTAKNTRESCVNNVLSTIQTLFLLQSMRIIFGDLLLTSATGTRTFFSTTVCTLLPTPANFDLTLFYVKTVAANAKNFQQCKENSIATVHLQHQNMYTNCSNLRSCQKKCQTKFFPFFQILRCSSSLFLFPCQVEPQD